MNDTLFKKTRFVVEATHNEMSLLWTKYSNESIFPTEFSIHKWEQIYRGQLVTIGYFADHPVNISCFWNYIDGVLVMFWEAVSMVTHYDMILKWLKTNCDSTAVYFDAANFCNVIHAIRECQNV